MTILIKQQPSSWRYLWLVVLISLPALGWWGILDEFSSRDINASISNAGLIYGTARGINALVSLLQGTELNVPFLTFSIGEVLDPVNDLIERFSDIVLLALGSLALQKILLALVSAKMFNILLTIVAAITALTVFLGRRELLSTMLRIFLVIAFFRLSLGLVVLANSWVDTTFLQHADQRRHAAMEKFQGDLRKIDALTQNPGVADPEVATTEQAIHRNEQVYNDAKLVLEEIDARIEKDTVDLQRLVRAAGGLCSFWDLLQLCPDKVKQAKMELDDKEESRSVLADSLDDLQEEIDGQHEKIDCLQKRERGESCKFFDSIPRPPDIAVLRHKLNDINTNISAFVENAINLLVSLLLKTVAIPFLFIYLLLKLVRVSWTRI